MSEREAQHLPEVLDEETRVSLDEGLRLAEANPQRWTPEQVREDAKRMTKEWREKVQKQASA